MIRRAFPLLLLLVAACSQAPAPNVTPDAAGDPGNGLPTCASRRPSSRSHRAIAPRRCAAPLQSPISPSIEFRRRSSRSRRRCRSRRRRRFARTAAPRSKSTCSSTRSARPTSRRSPSSASSQPVARDECQECDRPSGPSSRRSWPAARCRASITSWRRRRREGRSGSSGPLGRRRSRQRLEVVDEVRLVVVAQVIAQSPLQSSRVDTPRAASTRASTACARITRANILGDTPTCVANWRASCCRVMPISAASEATRRFPSRAHDAPHGRPHARAAAARAVEPARARIHRRREPRSLVGRGVDRAVERRRERSWFSDSNEHRSRPPAPPPEFRARRRRGPGRNRAPTYKRGSGPRTNSGFVIGPRRSPRARRPSIRPAGRTRR